MTPWKRVAIRNMRRDANTERTWAERWRKIGNTAAADSCEARAEQDDAKADELEGSEL